MFSKYVGRLQGDWPYRADRTPIFYGWVIAVISTLGFLFSVPGQTMGMAVFADAFIASFGLSRTELSLAYMLGTIGSALFLTKAGRLYDQLGARIMLTASALGLGCALVFISSIDLIAQQALHWVAVDLSIITFPLILLGYFGVRFSGQGVMTSVSTNMLLLWFRRNRGRVLGFRGVFISLGFSLSPILLAALIDDFGWRDSLLLLAVVVGPGFALLTFLTVRDRPEACDLQVDGGRAQPKVQQLAATSADLSADSDSKFNPSIDEHSDLGLAQVKRNPVFWLYSSALSMHALFGTAVTFHIVAIFAEAGRSRDEAFAYFIPQAVITVVVNLAASTLADYMRLKPFLLVMLVSFLFGAVGLMNLETNTGYWCLVAGFGVGGGLWGTLSNLVFIRQFGSAHLGEITGLNTAFTVFGSAIGPLIFSVALDLTGSMFNAALICAGLLVVLLVAAILIRQPLDHAPSALFRRGED
ncbi:MAG: MFS transporter [Gammaproteobacteria bacterium]|nr:MFS transporter [Gammaproteobacteria bacterium]